MPATSAAKATKNKITKSAQTNPPKTSARSRSTIRAQKPNRHQIEQEQHINDLTPSTDQTSTPHKHAAKVAPKTADLPPPRSTKQEIVLNLLSSPKGASIDEIMEATNWQKHSTRGFLAGTVKGKLGFTLSSSKTIGDERRYRIEQKKRR